MDAGYLWLLLLLLPLLAGISVTGEDDDTSL